MTRAELDLEVRKIIMSHLDVTENEIEDNSTMEALGADSLDRVEIVMAIEDKFNIEIKDTDIENAKTFSELIDLTEKTIAETGNAK